MNAERPVLLLVEDNPGDAGLATEAADWLGFDGEIAWVNDGQDAIEWMRRQVAERRPCPRLIVLDLNLPRMDGHEFLSRLRTGKDCPNAPVVVFSTSSREQDRVRTMKLGIARYVVKPRTWEDYIEAFRLIVDAWRAAA